jgi:hypothetical protein
MKKNLLWMAAAIMTCGLAFTACSQNDLPVGPDPVGPDDNWSKTTNVLDFEDGKPVFQATSRMSVAVEDNAEKGSKVLVLKNAGNTQNGYGFSYYNFADQVVNPTNIIIKFDYFNGAGRGCMTIGDGVVRGTNGANAGFARYTYGAKGAIFAVGATSDGKNYFVNDEILGTAADWCNKWLTVEVTVYTVSRQVAWKIYDGEEVVAQSGTTEGEGEEAVFTPGTVDYWQADADECTQIDCFGYVNNNISYIDNLSITNAQDPDDKYAEDVKIMFVDHEGNELKAAKVVSARVGSIVKLAGADKASFFNEDNTKKYIFAFDDTQYNPVAEKGTVIKAVFREAETCYAVLNCVIDGTTTTLYRFYDTEKYKFLEGDNLTIHPSRCYGKDGAYYVTKATTWNGTQFTFPGSIAPTVSSGKTVYIGTLNYELDESIVYFANFEDLALPTQDAGYGTGLGQLEGTVTNWWNWTNAYWERFDGGRSINLGDDSYVWTEPIAVGGTYNIVIYGRNNIYYGGEGYEIANPYKLGLRDAAGNITYLDVEIPAWGGSATGENVVEGVEIPAGSSIVIYNDGAKITAKDGTELVKDLSFDDIKVVKPAAAEE